MAILRPRLNPGSRLEAGNDVTERATSVSIKPIKSRFDALLVAGGAEVPPFDGKATMLSQWKVPRTLSPTYGISIDGSFDAFDSVN